MTSRNYSISKPAYFVFLITLGVFLPALRNGFVDWDDTVYLLANPHLNGWAWPNLRWLLTTPSLGDYNPLTWLSFFLDYQLWGPNPVGFHAVNVLLHSLNAALFF